MGSVDVSDVMVSCQPATYTIGGTISGLTASGLVLANGTDTLSISANATSFTMPKSLANGSTYDVTVQTQPTDLQCVISGGTGKIATSAVTSVVVTCTQHAVWTWMSGSSTTLASGVYGTEGVAAPGNVPGARQLSAFWTGSSGNLWLFGGRSPNNGADFNDLWSYNTTSGQWTWVSGSNSVAASGVYGTQGVPASGNAPGARDRAASWVDSADNLWLFGGEEYSASGTKYFNDLWEYNPASDEWTWVSGTSSADAAGTYGVKGVSAAGNAPGARAGAVSWIDAEGNLWLFGGVGYDGAGKTGDLADLWEFNVAAGQWIWISGPNIINSSGAYGSEGIAAATNAPGAREDTVSWIDAAGRLWLFGGLGYDSTGNFGVLGDLWRYDSSSGQWVWEGGSNTIDSTGIYGTQGVTASANIPGARSRADAWTDANGNFWLFGGSGFASSGAAALNDLWKYDVTSGQWTWESGSSIGGAMGVYGTEDVPSPNNAPGSRSGAASWIDPTGRLWLFGGMGCAAGSGTCITEQFLNDLWRY